MWYFQEREKMCADQQSAVARFFGIFARVFRGGLRNVGRWDMCVAREYIQRGVRYAGTSQRWRQERRIVSCPPRRAGPWLPRAVCVLWTTVCVECADAARSPSRSALSARRPRLCPLQEVGTLWNTGMGGGRTNERTFVCALNMDPTSLLASSSRLLARLKRSSRDLQLGLVPRGIGHRQPVLLGGAHRTSRRNLILSQSSATTTFVVCALRPTGRFFLSRCRRAAACLALQAAEQPWPLINSLSILSDRAPLQPDRIDKSADEPTYLDLSCLHCKFGNSKFLGVEMFKK